MQHGRTRQSLLLQCISLVKDYNPTQQSAVLFNVTIMTVHRCVSVLHLSCVSDFIRFFIKAVFSAVFSLTVLPGLLFVLIDFCYTVASVVCLSVVVCL